MVNPGGQQVPPTYAFDPSNGPVTVALPVAFPVQAQVRNNFK